jgi:hypothetical protein
MNKKRLKKLNHFLRRLPADKWVYSTFYHETACGTVCCAAGWCPVVFPNEWKYTKQHGTIPALIAREGYWRGPFEDLATFFELSIATCFAIFQNCAQFYKNLRVYQVTPVHVANLIAYYMRYNKLPDKYTLAP